MASVVKIILEDGHTKAYSKAERDNYKGDGKWHLIEDAAGCSWTFCAKAVFGMGDSDCKYDTKEGKVTCPDCIKKIKEIQSIKL